MADLTRKVTIQKGFDPRDFVLFAFGGAGPVHAGVYARELGVAKVVVPQKETASVWCAFGAAAADILHVFEQVKIMRSPFEASSINALLAELKARGAAALAADDVAEAQRRYRFTLDMRHKGQINEVEVALAGDTLEPDALPALHEAFVRRYELLYGRGAALPGATLEIVTFRCRASAAMLKPRLVAAESLSETIPEAAEMPARAVYWAEWQRAAETPVFAGEQLVPGNRIAGPAVIETAVTTVVVHPEQTLAVDAFGNFEILLGGADGEG
jgi:N-methylhydantoinase A